MLTSSRGQWVATDVKYQEMLSFLFEGDDLDKDDFSIGQNA